MVVGSTRVRTGGRKVHQASMFSLLCALEDIGFIQGRWVHSGAHWESLGSSGVVGLNCMRAGSLD